MDQSFWSNFIANFLATLIGIGIGLPIALWLDRIARKRNESEKIVEGKSRIIKILTVLQAELKENYNSIDYFNNSLSGKIFLISVESWNAFSDGGELQWLNDPELLGILSVTYSKISNYHLLFDKYLQMRIFTQSVGIPELMNNMYNHVIEHRVEAMKQIKICLDKINNRLNQ